MLDALAAEMIERKALDLILDSAEYEDVPLNQEQRRRWSRPARRRPSPANAATRRAAARKRNAAGRELMTTMLLPRAA